MPRRWGRHVSRISARRRRRSAMPLAAVLAVMACSSPPPPQAPAPPPPGVVELTVTAAEDLNPDASGRASPAVLRVYQLADAAKFQAADYFQLADNDAAILGADSIARVEL